MIKITFVLLHVVDMKLHSLLVNCVAHYPIEMLRIFWGRRGGSVEEGFLVLLIVLQELLIIPHKSLSRLIDFSLIPLILPLYLFFSQLHHL